jgi:hypothetical protein
MLVGVAAPAAAGVNPAGIADDRNQRINSARYPDGTSTHTVNDIHHCPRTALTSGDAEITRPAIASTAKPSKLR